MFGCEWILYLHETRPLAQAILVFLPGLGHIRDFYRFLEDHSISLRIYVLHSEQNMEEQSRVLELAPEVRPLPLISTPVPHERRSCSSAVMHVTPELEVLSSTPCGVGTQYPRR